MWSVDEINDRNETLQVQLRLALASPLWKSLPYGTQVNPRSWKIEKLELRPGRRLCALITVPWKSRTHAGSAGLRFVVLVWHNKLGASLHRIMKFFNERREAGGCSEHRLMFYDTLSHTFIVQCGRAKTARSAAGCPAPASLPEWVARAVHRACRARHLFKALP